jgi:hypothetical protein
MPDDPKTALEQPEANCYHNVIIFGAGASFDAGIPLLPSFVDKMWEYAIRRKAGENPLSPEDLTILNKANEIRLELERYNSRANFDTRNLEDILSLLSFEAVDNKEQTERYRTVVKAIARTIELSCNITLKDCEPGNAFRHGASVYHDLVKALLSQPWLSNLPAIITFNYDLVLERTLWQAFHFVDRENVKSSNPTVNSCGLDYHFGGCKFSIRREGIRYPSLLGSAQLMTTNGIRAEFIPNQPTEATIPYLKLHGSLNWNETQPHTADGEKTLIDAADTPLILPPVFNKMNSGDVSSVWREALTILRNAKTITIVGYSLPKTDIYMQYFLKAAVGPNSNLKQITVFDPVLFKADHQAEEMRHRYTDCFSQYLSGRIDFSPERFDGGVIKGTFEHFVKVITTKPYWEKSCFFP